MDKKRIQRIQRIERICRIQFREDRGPEEENRRKRSKEDDPGSVLIIFFLMCVTLKLLLNIADWQNTDPCIKFPRCLGWELMGLKQRALNDL
jgi:hypothetical protein